MPGLVAAKTPPPRISVGNSAANSEAGSLGAVSQIRSVTTPDRTDPVNPPRLYSPVVKRTPSPSPSTSRAKPSPDRSSGRKKQTPSTPERSGAKPPPTMPINIDESALDNPDLGPFLLKLARDSIAGGDGPNKALDYAIRASKSFERCAVDGEPSLDLAMSLHVVGAIYCSLGKFEDAIPVLERAIKVPQASRGADHALAAFSGYMQLGDTHSMLGQLDRSIECYKEGLKIQIEALGETDPRVAETCRYIAEAQVQAMQFDEAEKLCKQTLEIHRMHSAPASLEEAADRRLMALICEAKGDYESALEHLVLSSMAMIANGQDNEVASIDVSIGNVYQCLCRFDEAVFSYQKALTVFKSSKGENHPSVASVYIRLADLYYKTGKLRESKSYCENALRIYNKPVPGTTQEEIAGGLSDIAAIYESVNEPAEAQKLLQRSLKLLEDKPGQQSSIAGMEARMGVMHYMLGKYGEALSSFEAAVAKLRACGERKSAFFGVLLNQMGLACVQLFKIDEAAELFEEARAILEQECGPCHQDTLGVYSNLAATYDALGRIDDAIEILEYVLKLREEKLGTANADFDDEKNRLTELLKEAGRSRNRKAKSLENLIDPNSKRTKKEPTKKRSGFEWSLSIWHQSRSFRIAKTNNLDSPHPPSSEPPINADTQTTQTTNADLSRQIAAMASRLEALDGLAIKVPTLKAHSVSHAAGNDGTPETSNHGRQKYHGPPYDRGRHHWRDVLPIPVGWVRINAWYKVACNFRHNSDEQEGEVCDSANQWEKV
ncbi:hypothetical protein V2J09_022514 [Rumex salicifolius]